MYDANTRAMQIRKTESDMVGLLATLVSMQKWGLWQKTHIFHAIAIWVLLNPVLRIASYHERHKNEWLIVKNVGPKELKDVRMSEFRPRLSKNISTLGVVLG